MSSAGLVARQTVNGSLPEPTPYGFGDMRGRPRTSRWLKGSGGAPLGGAARLVGLPRTAQRLRRLLLRQERVTALTVVGWLAQ